jgi:hypothetical protein
MPGDRAGDVEYLRSKRDLMLRALAEQGRDASGFAFAGQVTAGTTPDERRTALEKARAFVAAGADHVVLAIPARAGPDALAGLAAEVAEPLRDAWD